MKNKVHLEHSSHPAVEVDTSLIWKVARTKMWPGKMLTTPSCVKVKKLKKKKIMDKYLHLLVLTVCRQSS